MKNRIILILVLINLCSCFGDKNNNSKLIVINGKIIDITRKTNYANHQITASFAYDSKVKTIANAVVDSNGEFKIEYYTESDYEGNNLRLTFLPSIPWIYKFDYLPYGTNWTKNFYLSDSAKIFFKNKFNFNNEDTVTLFSNPRTYTFIVSKNKNLIGKINTVNLNGNLLYKINSRPMQSIFLNPTGDPIVDTITLDINP